MRYINIQRLTELPDISSLAPFKAVISTEAPTDRQRQKEISTWLVRMGCRYVISRGENCESWCQSVRQANLAAFDIDNMHARDFVMTTVHRRESLKAVFWFAKKAAKHPEVDLVRCVVLHVANGNRMAEYQAVYQRA